MTHIKVMSLKDELKQTRAFRSLEQEALLSIERTAAVLGYAFAEELKAYDLTPTQYNVLRILRGAGETGLCRHEVRARLIAPVPDVTRLLDRMESAELIERERDSQDRRLVRTRITKRALGLIAKLDEPMEEIHQRQLGHMSKADLRRLVGLLEEARKAP
ncbi:MarR family transcriptional regulator [soil metagenome]